MDAELKHGGIVKIMTSQKLIQNSVFVFGESCQSKIPRNVDLFRPRSHIAKIIRSAFDLCFSHCHDNKQLF